MMNKSIALFLAILVYQINTWAQPALCGKCGEMIALEGQLKKIPLPPKTTDDEHRQDDLVAKADRLIYEALVNFENDRDPMVVRSLMLLMIKLAPHDIRRISYQDSWQLFRKYYQNSPDNMFRRGIDQLLNNKEITQKELKFFFVDYNMLPKSK